jgi:two-component system nitrate/nitrite response regulator NarL
MKSRRRLRDALQANGGIVVVAGAASGVEALELANYYHPDAILTDLPLPHLDGISLTRQVAETDPDVSVLIYAADDALDTQFAAFRAGARGFVSRSRPSSAAVAAIETVLAGGSVVPDELAAALVARLHDEPEHGRGLRPIRSELTTREWEVADLMCSGYDTRGIAEELVLSEETVYTHIKHLLRKLEVHSRGEAVEVTKRIRSSAGEDPRDGAK